MCRCIGMISMPSSCATLSGMSDVLSVTILMLAMRMASSVLFCRNDVIVERLPAGLHFDLDAREALGDALAQRIGRLARDRLTIVDGDDLAIVELHAPKQV